MNPVVARTRRFAVLRTAFCVLSLLGAGGCGGRPLSDTQASAEALALAVMDAIERRDEPTLRRLALNEEEFREHVWPELPAARPERNLPMSYVWSDLNQKSNGGLRTLLAEHGGQHYSLVHLRFDGDTTDYGGAYRVHRGSAFVVRKGSSDPVELRLCGSMLEKDGQWKVFSYVIDD